MDVLSIVGIALCWFSPLGFLALSSRCPRRYLALWRLTVATTSWLGLAAYVAIYYWWPELHQRDPKVRRHALG